LRICLPWLTSGFHGIYTYYNGPIQGYFALLLAITDLFGAIMNYYSMTDKSIGIEIGNRLKRLRLRQNRTQQQVADAVALSLNVIKSLEAGKGKLASLIAILRELEALDSLSLFIKEEQVSPLQLAKQQGRRRKRATGKRCKVKPGDQSEW